MNIDLLIVWVIILVAFIQANNHTLLWKKGVIPDKIQASIARFVLGFGACVLVMIVEGAGIWQAIAYFFYMAFLFNIVFDTAMGFAVFDNPFKFGNSSFFDSVQTKIVKVIWPSLWWFIKWGITLGIYAIYVNL